MFTRFRVYEYGLGYDWRDEQWFPVVRHCRLCLGCLVLDFCHFRIIPLWIRASEISAMADAFIAAHGERAQEIAFIHEDRAWRYSHAVEQGIWRRVREELRRREMSLGE